MITLCMTYLNRTLKLRAALAVFMKVVEVVFDLMTPLIVAHIIDEGVIEHNITVVVQSVLLLVVLALVGYASTLVCQYQASFVSQSLGTLLRQRVFHKAWRVSYLQAPDAQTLTTRISSDTNQVQVALALGLRQLMRWPLLAVGSVVCALGLRLELGLVLLLAAPLIALLFWWVMHHTIPRYMRLQTLLERLSGIAQEMLSGIKTVRAAQKESWYEGRFSTTAHDAQHIASTAQFFSALLNPLSMAIMNLGIIAILWQGAGLIELGAATQGELIAFVNYLMQAALAIVYVANLLVTFNKGEASARRLLALFALPEDQRGTIEDLEVPGGAAEVPGGAAQPPVLAARDLSFTYPGAPTPALGPLTVTLSAGQTLGIIGGTGSGKSTFAHLIAGLIKPTAGTLELFGKPLEALSNDARARLVSVVPQKTSLLEGTLRHNLTLRATDATDAELMDALSVAQATNILEAHGQGLEMHVAAGGTNFSGGQRQRLTIARALVGKPRLLVLDDAASALDFKTDAALRRELSLLANKCALSTIIISQRVSTVMGAHQILVLDRGAVVGLGTHQDLIQNNPVYQEICMSQGMEVSHE